MAGDWIKMRIDLQHGDPHVVRIMSALHADTCPHDCGHLYATIGALHALWCVFDAHSIDGTLTFTPQEMDTFLRWPGFTQAVIDAGWLAFDGANTLTMDNFESHNGQGAKRRATEQKRKRNMRTSVRKTSAPTRTREEKSIYNPPTPLSGGLSPREFKKVSKELQQIGKAMVGSNFSMEDALRKACLNAGVDFNRARYMLDESHDK